MARKAKPVTLPSWRPATPSTVKRLGREAEALERRAQEEGRPELATRAAGLRVEQRLARYVVDYRAPNLDPGGDLPHGPARGQLDAATISEIGIDPRTGAERIVERRVRRRRGSAALASLSAPLRAAADRYAALVEAVGASRGSSLDLPVRSGLLSDGGAVTRTRLAQRLRRARLAIGPGLVLRPRRARADPARPRRPLTVLQLVDGVAVFGQSLEAVLKRRGWCASRAHCRKLRHELEAALDRLRDVF